MPLILAGSGQCPRPNFWHFCRLSHRHVSSFHPSIHPSFAFLELIWNHMIYTADSLNSLLNTVYQVERTGSMSVYSVYYILIFCNYLSRFCCSFYSLFTADVWPELMKLRWDEPWLSIRGRGHWRCWMCRPGPGPRRWRARLQRCVPKNHCSQLRHTIVNYKYTMWCSSAEISD